MPSSVIRHSLSMVDMIDYPFLPPSYRADEALISASSWCAAGSEMNAFTATSAAVASSTYPATNRALGFMFCLSDYYLVRKVWWMNGTTATTDSADVGVYTEAGALLVSGGSTAIATANVVQEKDCTDTLLTPGRYWCVYNQNGTTATPLMSPLSVTFARASGWAQFAGAVPLGSTFTPAAVAAANVPLFGISNRTQVA